MAREPVVITVRFDVMRLSPNARMHWREHHRRTRQVHEAARLAWLCAGSPVLDGFAEVSHLIRRGRRMDADNALASCKHLNDALLCRNRRGYGVVADDDASHVRYAPVQFETGKEWRGKEEVVVTITPVEAE